MVEKKKPKISYIYIYTYVYNENDYIESFANLGYGIWKTQRGRSCGLLKRNSLKPKMILSRFRALAKSSVKCLGLFIMNAVISLSLSFYVYIYIYIYVCVVEFFFIYYIDLVGFRELALFSKYVFFFFFFFFKAKFLGS